jgi:uncharacterized protein (DUF433 family)
MIVTLDSRIVKDPKIAGGKPRIAGHRITVKDIVIWHELLGYSPDRIVTEYGLTLVDIYMALAYYYDNQQEIDKSIRETNDIVARLKKQTPSRIRNKPDGNGSKVLHG